MHQLLAESGEDSGHLPKNESSALQESLSRGECVARASVGATKVSDINFLTAVSYLKNSFLALLSEGVQGGNWPQCLKSC